MSEWTRGWKHFANVGQQASALWDPIDNRVMKQWGKKTFDDLTLSDDLLTDYQPSPSTKPRFDLVEGHSRYKREADAGRALGKDVPLGPVELDLLGFADSSNPTFLVLLGGM